MDVSGFRKYLKQKGKKEHVVNGLVEQVRQLEGYLSCERQQTLEHAGPSDLQAYIETLVQKDPRSAKKWVRGIASYFHFTGQDDLAALAASFREDQIVRTRTSFALKGFRGVRPEVVDKLAEAGIVNVEHILAAGNTPQARADLAAQTGLPPGDILELVKLADISRLGAIKEVRARLYYDAGLDTPDKFTEWEPAALRQMLVDFVQRTGFEGIAPLPKEIRNAIQTARQIRRLVEYEDKRTP